MAVEIIISAGARIDRAVVDLLMEREEMLKRSYPDTRVSIEMGDTEYMVAKVDEEPKPDQIRLGLIGGPALCNTDQHCLVALLSQEPRVGFIANQQIMRNQSPTLMAMVMAMAAGTAPTGSGTSLVLLRS